MYRQPWTKSHAGYRTLVLPQFAVGMLTARRHAARENPNDAIFASRRGTWLSPNNVRRQWRQARADTDLSWVTPHTFRKTVATLIRQEADTPSAAAQPGHASEQVTATYYTAKPAPAPDVSRILEQLGADQGDAASRVPDHLQHRSDRGTGVRSPARPSRPAGERRACPTMDPHRRCCTESGCGRLGTMVDESLVRIADLLRERNAIDAQITQIIDRPMTSGHLGEWIAARIFAIALEPSATATAIDGRFTAGPLAGRSVNVKWYLKREGLLDLTASPALDYYLVLTGPAGPPVSTRGGLRPWCISAVYLFDSRQLLSEQRTRGVKIGVAASVRAAQWAAAEIYPRPANPLLEVGPQQAALLRLFTPDSMGSGPKAG